jgi:plasmid replication initiation protein
MPVRKTPPNDAQLELFSALLTDISTRDIQETMEVPFLSLSKKPRFQPIMYKANGVQVTVTGGAPYGIANIWDWDLIMWLLSQIRQALDEGHDVSRKIRFNRHAFLKDARRETGGQQYRRLEDTIARLKNTNVNTSIRAKNRRTVMFSWLEYAEIDRDEDGRLRDVTVVLPEWLFEAVCDNRLVLSLHPDYFLLTGGIERWLYRFIRKQAGDNSKGWSWRFETLYERSGSTQRFSDFKVTLREIVRKGDLLDYQLKVSKRVGGEYLYALRKDEGDQKAMAATPVVVSEDAKLQFLHLRTTTYEKAKQLAPGYDIYAVEADWRYATSKNNVVLKDPDAAFLAWCKKVGQKNAIS